MKQQGANQLIEGYEDRPIINKVSMFSLGLEALALKDLIENPEIDDETGEFINNDKTLNALFDELSKSTNSKLDSAMYIVREFEATTEALKVEIARLQARKKASENNVTRLKQRIFELVNLQSDKKVKTEFNSFSIRKSESLEIADEKAVPSDYIEFTKKINKAELKKDIKNGKFEATDKIYIKRNSTLGVR